jgi:hypothetical protein
VQGLGFGVWVYGVGYRVWGLLGFRVLDAAPISAAASSQSDHGAHRVSAAQR